MECHSPGLRIHLKIYDHCIMLFSQYGTYGIWNKAMEICVPYMCPSSLVTCVPLTILSVIYLRNLHLLSLLLHSLHICRDPGFHKETIPPLTWNESFFKCCDMAAKRPAGKRRVSILAGAIVSDYQDRVDDRESLLNAKANLLDHFLFLACQVLRVNYICNNQRQRKTLWPAAQTPQIGGFISPPHVNHLEH